MTQNCSKYRKYICEGCGKRVPLKEICSVGTSNGTFLGVRCRKCKDWKQVQDTEISVLCTELKWKNKQIGKFRVVCDKLKGFCREREKENEELRERIRDEIWVQAQSRIVTCACDKNIEQDKLNRKLDKKHRFATKKEQVVYEVDACCNVLKIRMIDLRELLYNGKLKSSAGGTGTANTEGEKK